MHVQRLFGKLVQILGNLFSQYATWEELYIASSRRPEPVLKRFSLLESHGIRCKLYNLNSPSGRGVYAGMVSLRVHPDDATKAKALLNNFQDIPAS